MNEPRVVESVTNECQLLGRAHESSSARAEQLIACLEGEIAKRDARIVELDAVGVANEKLTQRIKELKAELAALKAQEPVGWYTEDHLDDKSATTYSKEFADRWVAKGWPVFPLYAAPVSEAKAQGVVMLPSVAEVMNIVFDYQHNKNKNVTGTTNWAANIGMAVIDAVVRLNAAPSPAGADGCRCSMSISVLGDGCRYCQPQEYIDRLGEMLDEERAELSDAQAIIDGLRGEIEALHAQVKVLQSDANSWQSGYDEGRRMGGKHCALTIDQQAQRIGELEGLLLRVQVSLSLDDTEWGYSGAEKYKLLADIRTTLSAGKEGE